jgi:hypothetical protein
MAMILDMRSPQPSGQKAAIMVGARTGGTAPASAASDIRYCSWEAPFILKEVDMVITDLCARCIDLVGIYDIPSCSRNATFVLKAMAIVC